MNARHIGILAALIAGLLLLSMLLRTLPESGSRGGGLLLDGLAADANDIQRVEVAAPDEPAFVVERVGGRWLVAALDDYPADFSKLATLVSDLAAANILEEKTSKPENYGRLGLAEAGSEGAGTLLTLSGEGFHYRVILGNAAQQGFRYARLPGDAGSYLVDQPLSVDASPDDWLDADILDLPADRIRRVAIEHADGEQLVIEKEAPDASVFAVPGVPEGRELSYPAVGNSIAGALASLKLETVRKAADAEPLATTIFEAWNGLRVTVTSHGDGDGDERWLTFVASSSAASDRLDTPEPAAEAATEAAAINERLGAWQYRIADYKQEQLLRRWEDILRAANDS